MATRTIDKFQVMAQCVHIIQRQLRNTRNPQMRTVLENAANRFGAIGMAEEYKMIAYKNCIYIIHNDFKNKPNLQLSNDGKLYIGKLDIALRFNDRKCIRIHGDGTADCGYSMHGIMTGDCITERLEYENGKPKRFGYEEQPLPPYMQDGLRVNNDYSLGFFGRIRRNGTIGRKDFLLGLLLLVAANYATMALVALSGSLGIILTAVAGVLILAAAVMLVAKRIGDIGYFGGARAALVLLTLFLPIMFIVLLFVPTKIVSESEYEADKQRWQKRVDEGEHALARRCDAIDADIDWFRITPEVMALTDRLAGRASGIPSPSYPNHYPEDDQAAEEEMNPCPEEEPEEPSSADEDDDREQEYEKKKRRDELKGKIYELSSELSREESKSNRAQSEYDRAKQQAEIYLSYARSTGDEALRRDYEQSAERYLDDARSAESDKSDADSNISDLKSRIADLERELSNL